jgi:hypothetical protein
MSHDDEADAVPDDLAQLFAVVCRGHTYTADKIEGAERRLQERGLPATLDDALRLLQEERKAPRKPARKAKRRG